MLGNGIGLYYVHKVPDVTPKGNWINGKGVEPDVKVSLYDEYYNNPSDDTYPQSADKLFLC